MGGEAGAEGSRLGGIAVADFPGVGRGLMCPCDMVCRFLVAEVEIGCGIGRGCSSSVSIVEARLCMIDDGIEVGPSILLMVKFAQRSARY